MCTTILQTLGLDPQRIAERHADHLFDLWSRTGLTSDECEAAIRQTFESDVTAVAWLAGATRPVDVEVIRAALAHFFAGRWCERQAARVLQ